jgi:hypothetical protein
MIENSYAYLRDEHDRLRSYESLPEHITELADDPYRGLAGEVRDAGGFRKTTTPGVEFVWSRYFRTKFTREALLRDWQASIERGVALARSPEAQNLPGYRGPTCRSLFH